MSGGLEPSDDDEDDTETQQQRGCNAEPEDEDDECDEEEEEEEEEEEDDGPTTVGCERANEDEEEEEEEDDEESEDVPIPVATNAAGRKAIEGPLPPPPLPPPPLLQKQTTRAAAPLAAGALPPKKTKKKAASAAAGPRPRHSGGDEPPPPAADSDENSENEPSDRPTKSIAMKRLQVPVEHFDAVGEAEHARQQGVQQSAAAPTVTTLTDGVRDQTFLDKVQLVQLSSSTTHSAAIVPMADVMHVVVVDDEGTPMQPFNVAKDVLRGNMKLVRDAQIKLLHEQPSRVLRSTIVTRVRPKDANGSGHDHFQFSLPVIPLLEEGEAIAIVEEVKAAVPGGYCLNWPLDPKVVADLYKMNKQGLPTKYAPSDTVKVHALKNVERHAEVDNGWRLVVTGGKRGGASGGAAGGGGKKRAAAAAAAPPPPAAAAAGASAAAEAPEAAATAGAAPAPAKRSKLNNNGGTTAQQRAGQLTMTNMLSSVAAPSGGGGTTTTTTNDAAAAAEVWLEKMMKQLSPSVPNMHGALLTLPAPATVQCTQIDSTHIFLMLKTD